MIRFDSDDFLIDFASVTNPIPFEKTNLFQVGKKFCTSSTDMRPHAHINWFEITVITEGEGKVFANDSFSSVKAGDVFLSFPTDIHKITSNPNNPLKFAFLSFSLNDDSLKEQFDNIVKLFPRAEKRVFQNANIPALIDVIIAEMYSHEFMKDRVISSALNQIVVFIARAFLHSNTKTIYNHASKNKILCFKIMRYIDNNIHSIQSLSEVADFYHYNYTYMAKLFAKTTGETMKQYLAKQKLDYAKYLIKSRNLSLTEISSLLNYSSIYSFSKSFKKHFGISPSEYAKQ